SHAARARDGGIPRHVGGEPAHGRGHARRDGARGDHDRRQRAGARRRRAPLHDPAAAARRPLNGLAALPYATLAERAHSYLEAGPASSGALARDVLGLSRTPKIAAERLALAL